MNRSLIDTDILSYFFKGIPSVVSGFQKYLKEYNQIEISIISVYEIRSGLFAKGALKQLAEFERFLSGCNVIPLSDQSVQISAEIYGKLKKEGQRLDDIDLLIAGIALENGFSLVTNNLKHFSRIPGLSVENWNS